MPSNTQTGGAAGGAATVGLLVGLAFGGGGAPAPVDPTVAAAAMDQLDTMEITQQDGTVYAVLEKKAGDVQTSVTPYSAQYVANAIKACDEYEAAKGARTARCARWDTMKTRITSAGHGFPAAE